MSLSKPNGHKLWENSVGRSGRVETESQLQRSQREQIYTYCTMSHLNMHGRKIRLYSGRTYTTAQEQKSVH